MKVYVASSWRNGFQPDVVAFLTQQGHAVYDFRHPAPGNDGFQWRECDPDWRGWTATEYLDGLRHPAAQAGFKYDMDALRECDACVLVLPCGRSAHLEAGWAAGAGKRVVILLDGTFEPELMYLVSTAVVTTLDAVQAALE